MSEARILLCGPALDGTETACRLEMLRNVTLPNVTKFVVTVGKFDANGVAKTFNIESGYPAEPAHLQTLAAWAECPFRSGPRFRDGYDLFCLRSILAKNAAFDYAVLLRAPGGLQDFWADLRSIIESRLFVTFQDVLREGGGGAAESNVVFDVGDKRAGRFLDLAWELYETGAVYAMSSYSLDLALSDAREALGIEDQVAESGLT